MIRRIWIPLFVLVCLTAFVSGGAASPGAAQGNHKALVQVLIDSSGDLARFAETGLPVYARLTGLSGSYLLTGGNDTHLASLDRAGLHATVLDAAIGDAYYVVELLPGQLAPDWDSYGRLLLDDGRQLLVRVAPQHEAALLTTGVSLQLLPLTPKPLYPHGSPADFPTVLDPDPIVQAMIDQVTTPLVEGLTAGLSGETPVSIGGSDYTIATRNTYSGTPIQKATQYAGEQLAALGLDVEYHQWGGATYPNVIGELAGQINPDQIYMIGAHLDDMPTGPLAPGADDNASGSVATLLAAQLLTQYEWSCTLRFAFWTGEEQGLLGSEAYAQQAFNAGEDIVGYLNLDMIAWNSAGTNPDIDLHANSSLPATLTLAQLFADVVDAYNLDLVPQIVPNGSGASDHASFWQYGYTSILGIEDFSDFNPYYHTTSDDMDNFEDWPYYTEFVKASLATFVHMSGCMISEGLGQLEGTVTAADGGAPIESAEIVAENPDGMQFHATTDASGYYTRTLMAGTYTVTASAFSYLPATVTGVEVITDSAALQDFSLAKAPVHNVSGIVTEAGTGDPLYAQIAVLDAPLAPVWTDPGTGAYSLSMPEGTYTLQASASGHHPEQAVVVVDDDLTQDFSLQPLACILLVDDDNNDPDVRTSFTAALNSLGYGYDVFDVGGGGANGPDLDGLLGYSHVIWFSGDKFGDSAGPNSTDEAALADYLDGGGNLFLSAQDYLYDYGLTSFGQTYLGIGNYSNDTGNAASKYGVAGDPIGGGLGPYTLVYPAGFADYGDIVNPQAPASVAFTSTAGGGNNLDLDKDGGAWKTVFFGTSWVPIYTANAANGIEALDQVVQWFGGCEPTAPAVTVDPDALSATLDPDSTEDYPLVIGNQGTASLTWSLTEDPQSGWLTQDVLGGTLAPGDSVTVTVTFDSTGLGEGVYTTSLELTSNDPNEPLIIVPVTLTVESGELEWKLFLPITIREDSTLVP